MNPHGQLIAGEALYLRDIARATEHPVRKSQAKILKAVCLFEMFSLYDSGIELLEYAVANSLLPPALGNKADLLVPPLFERYLSLDRYRELFKSLPQYVM